MSTPRPSDVAPLRAMLALLLEEWNDEDGYEHSIACDARPIEESDHRDPGTLALNAALVEETCNCQKGVVRGIARGLLSESPETFGEWAALLDEYVASRRLAEKVMRDKIARMIARGESEQ